jgi:pimeloyl-ACP methyl ester carboxylesterase
VDRALLDVLREHWAEGYDWRKHEAELNAFKHFKLHVEALELHFIHERSRVPGAVPLLLIHGWPGSVWEFHKILPKLSNPTGRALRLKQAFHVVAPSLPGFGFSEAAAGPGMNVGRIARMFNDLMHKLG